LAIAAPMLREPPVTMAILPVSGSVEVFMVEPLGGWS
jgi:hypothetical protein